VSNPLSTFSIDVDTASYANIRRFLGANTLPVKDAVRIEEMVNYFTYDYPQPKEGEPFSITTELSGCPWKPEHKLVLIGLQGRQLEANKAPASNLVFLIDVSGSMAESNKLPLVKSAFRLLAGQLRAEDRVSIVTYAGSAGVALDSCSGSETNRIIDAIEGLQSGGCTAGAQGIVTAYEIAKKNFIRNGNNRVILATDGDFNIGVSSDAELTRMIEEKRDDGIFLTVLGFGTGNYKDSRMEKLADKGNGNFAYVDNLMEAKKVFVTGLTGTLFTIAKDVKIQVEFNPSKVKAYRLIGYENRMLKKEDFNDDKKDAGEMGAGHRVTALYEIVPADSKEEFGSVDQLKYQTTAVSGSRELLTVKLRYKEPDGDQSKLITRQLDAAEKEASENLKFATAVAEFGMLLRDSKYKGSANFSDVIARAKQAKGRDDDGYRAEFIRLVEQAELLSMK
jgi:Ca-activated chloride channel family protein